MYDDPAVWEQLTEAERASAYEGYMAVARDAFVSGCALEGLDGYRHYHSARADLLRRLERRDEAHVAYARALELTDDGPERRFFERRFGETLPGPPE